MAGLSKVVQKWPKRSTWVIFDHFGPLWAFPTLLGHFRQKWISCPKWTKYDLAEVLRSKKSIFVWNSQKWSQWVQRGAKWSKTLRFRILVLFEPFWITLERWQACHVCPFLVQNGPFFAIPPQSWALDPNTRKGSSPGLLCVACLETPKHAIGESWTFCWEMEVNLNIPHLKIAPLVGNL